MQSSDIITDEIIDSINTLSDTEESNTKEQENEKTFIRTFSNLILDQINHQDTYQLLSTQRQMLAF